MFRKTLNFIYHQIVSMLSRIKFAIKILCFFNAMVLIVMIIELLVWLIFGPSQRITSYPEDWAVSNIIEYAVEYNGRLKKLQITNPDLYARKIDKVYRFLEFMSRNDFHNVYGDIYIRIGFDFNPYPYLHVLSECVRLTIRAFLFLLNLLYGWWDEELAQDIKELDIYFTPENFSDLTVLKFIYVVMKYVIFFITITPIRLCKK